jgi:predicted transcriptional regulator
MKPNISKAKRHLTKIREIIAKNPSPIFRMSKEDVIKTLRKTREEIWEEKVAPCH